MSKEYRSEIDEKCQKKIDELSEKLPAFCRLYVTAVSRTRSKRTMQTYLQRDYYFFSFLCLNHSHFCEMTPVQIRLEDLDYITLNDANIFLDHLYSHQANNAKKTNSKNTVEGYISALNALFTYLYKNSYVKANPFSAVERKHEKIEKPLYLEGNENVTFYESVLNGTGLTQKQLTYRKKQHTAYRDYLICRVLGTTGIRISELIGLNIEDIDLKNAKFKVIRKGNKVQTIYFSEKLRDEFIEYIDNVRPFYHPDKKETALFLVAQGKFQGTRVSSKIVEEMVKKYAKAQGLSESYRFTPHKLRHTYAMNVLRKSQNLKLTQQLLGHEDISTTTIYSRMLEEDLKNARNLGEN